jgi:hypothetical protein
MFSNKQYFKVQKIKQVNDATQTIL